MTMPHDAQTDSASSIVLRAFCEFCADFVPRSSLAAVRTSIRYISQMGSLRYGKGPLIHFVSLCQCSKAAVKLVPTEPPAGTFDQRPRSIQFHQKDRVLRCFPQLHLSICQPHLRLQGPQALTVSCYLIYGKLKLQKFQDQSYWKNQTSRPTAAELSCLPAEPKGCSSLE